MTAGASPGERRRLNDLFAELCAVPSPSRAEARCAGRVRGELEGLGLAVAEDDAARTVGSDGGNLLCRVPGPDGAPTLLLCAHLDTVPPLAPIRPEIWEGHWVNAEDGILGADNKAAVAVLLLAARRAAAGALPCGLELLFTVCEEDGLRGARAFAADRLESSFGYVFDHATPLGEVVVAAPSYHRLVADFIGVSAHAGVRPEEGRSAILAAARALAAMPLGRLDDATTANAGVISGGSASNVVPGTCRVELEARALEDERVEQVVADMVDRLQDGANAEECDVEVSVEKLFAAFRVRPNEPVLQVAEAALRSCGHEPRRIRTGGGSDANALQAAGFPCVNLADGSERNHQPDERISVEALEGLLDVALALAEETARAC